MMMAALPTDAGNRHVTASLRHLFRSVEDAVILRLASLPLGFIAFPNLSQRLTRRRRLVLFTD
jgi:hypothetical protein